MPAAEVLDRAADLISVVGLCQGSFWAGFNEGESYRFGSPVCAAGAVYVIRGLTEPAAVAERVGGSDAALSALTAALELPDDTWIGNWNDRFAWWPWFARRRVLEALRRAARVSRG